jgi:hypothetical protein
MENNLSFKQFEIEMKTAMKPLLVDAFEGEGGAEIKTSIGHFLADGTRTNRRHRSYSAIEKFHGLLFSGFAEISASFYTLRDIEIIFRSVTARQSKVMKARLLSYHVHNYLNENYILKSRLERYPVTILRAAKHWSEQHHIIEPINQALSEAFGNIVALRGRHVHDRRYTDDDLDRLSMLEMISDPETPLGKAIRELFKLEFGICRSKWLERMQNNNDAVEELLGIYCTLLHPFIFDDKGGFVVPSKLAGA